MVLKRLSAREDWIRHWYTSSLIFPNMKRNSTPFNSDINGTSRPRRSSIAEKRAVPGSFFAPKINLKPNSEQDRREIEQLINLPFEEFPKKTSRLFDLPEAPVYYPTEEEFLDPNRYIQSIRGEAEKYGLCKVIPPPSWRPSFAIDTSAFQFQARLQKLNLIGAKTRNKINYMEKLSIFHKQLGTNMRFLPPIVRKKIDLYQLKEEVSRRGGEKKVTRDKSWGDVGIALGLSEKQSRQLSEAFQLAFINLVEPYETYLSESGSEPASPPQGLGSCCEKCASDANKDQLVICEDCDRAFHIYCLKPVMTNKPQNWACATCLKSQVQDFGFGLGRNYSLCSFKRRADQFKKKWFPEIDSSMSRIEREDIVEKEFWRLVDSPFEAVTVEYAADLHCPYYGSGFPTLATDPQNPMSKHPWNLTVLPTLPESLLTYLTNDVSGMTVPWVYSGMCFSTFCWHNEDHYTYSVNYHHWGDTKTWYTVPGSHATSFERAIETEVPDLFEKQPDLLFHLSTLLSPADLQKHKVPVYVTDQRAGQFVITFPQAYHSGFNHGFNFNEAVNFATADWLPFGLDCIQKYSKFSWMPVFSHHELLLTTVRNTTSYNQAKTLIKPMTELRSEELKRREELCNFTENIQSAPKDSRQCFHCHKYCYLSSITCLCSVSDNKFSCYSHMKELCKCTFDNRVLQLHVEKQELDRLVMKLENIIMPSIEIDLTLSP